MITEDLKNVEFDFINEVRDPDNQYFFFQENYYGHH